MAWRYIAISTVPGPTGDVCVTAAVVLCGHIACGIMASGSRKMTSFSLRSLSRSVAIVFISAGAARGASGGSRAGSLRCVRSVARPGLPARCASVRLIAHADSVRS